MLEVEKVRRDFPILSRQIHGKPLVYLDNAATTQMPTSVIADLVDYYQHYNANVHRAIHALGEEATARYEEARGKVARFIGASNPATVIFTRNTTESINLVANTWARTHLRSGDEILLTEMEHHSNLVPWQKVAQETGARLKFIPVNPQGMLDLSTLDNLLTNHTRLLAIVHMSNVLGTINPVGDLARRAHEVGAVVLVDGAQSVPHLVTHIEEMDCDFLAFSGHKMLGPMGIGVLYVRESILEGMEPFLRGGEMVREVRFTQATWNDLPYRFEAGTPNVAGAIALGAAIDYLEALGMDNVRQHEVRLTRYALEAFRKLEDVVIYGPHDVAIRGGILSFSLQGIHPHDLGTFIDRQGIAIRAGHHCAMPLVRERLGVSAVSRASFYVYNTEEEIDILVQGIIKARDFFNPSIPKGSER